MGRMKDSSTIVDSVKAYALKVLQEELPANMTYHSINHTLEVVRSVQEIAEKQRLSDEEREIVMIAAWLHDIGYAKGCEFHEQKGAEIARKFLKENGYPKDKIDLVVGFIMATQLPQNPKNILEQIICDADMMHLADQDYIAKAALLHEEIEKTKACKIDEADWLKMNQDFLDKHCFFTEYAKKNYGSAVRENLKKVRKKLKSWSKTEK